MTTTQCKCHYFFNFFVSQMMEQGKKLEKYSTVDLTTIKNQVVSTVKVEINRD